MRTVLVGVALCWIAVFAIGGWMWLGIALLASGVLELALFGWDRWRDAYGVRRYTKRRTWASKHELERMTPAERSAYFNARASLAIAALPENKGTSSREVGE